MSCVSFDVHNAEVISSFIVKQEQIMFANAKWNAYKSLWF